VARRAALRMAAAKVDTRGVSASESAESTSRLVPVENLALPPPSSLDVVMPSDPRANTVTTESPSDDDPLEASDTPVRGPSSSMPGNGMLEMRRDGRRLLKRPDDVLEVCDASLRRRDVRFGRPMPRAAPYRSMPASAEAWVSKPHDDCASAGEKDSGVAGRLPRPEARIVEPEKPSK